MITDLFLVDAPVKQEQALVAAHDVGIPSDLRFCYSDNRGGVLLPEVPRTGFCELFLALTKAFKYYWQVEYIHERDHVFADAPLLYVLSSSMWELNIADMDSQINHISYYRMRDPTIKISDSLHGIH